MVSSNDVQRLFLQAVISRRVLSYKLAHTVWLKCIDAVKETVQIPVPRAEDRAAWDAFVAKVNDSLNDLDLEFRHLHDEQNGREMYALVNRKGDEIAQLATDYTPTEIAYFKAIVEQIMLAPHESFSVSSLAALREVNFLKANMTKTQAEVVLGSFVAKGWLVKSQRGRYSLSTRSLLELLPYLKSTYPDEVLECTICLEILTRGIACNTRNCKVRLHGHCFNNYKRVHSTCPSCNESWTSGTKKIVPVGEGAVKDGQDFARRVRKKQTEEASDEEEDEDAEGSHEPSQTQGPSQAQSQSQKTAGKKGRAKATDAPDNSMDVDEEGPPRRSQRKSRR
ncbi:hypothetical protein GLOTRDRAFT_35587 [Gloeophyllum trabeum ATCC 11539]|uniref:Non-structural maintenance of chromosomes element 1 homolog n=1 Tax=Gloeophyllum trabeum (strain ATCC 11539 / FP-39264 / Madison 617) TaxID=670483 RepID=S7RXX4_GLOTA|nr:uncharacterized protein GLOTRDRAFT_35587 [Gloeophyllum trabeum ATCC 11539]EPQ58234.1 hypothetical protein GLOTRDRAFT_35587 [Gloeophyllum trabeum ATCC 11539]